MLSILRFGSARSRAGEIVPKCARRTALLAVLGLALWAPVGCGPSRPTRPAMLPGVSEPPKPVSPRETVAPQARRPGLPVVGLDEEFEIRGYSGVILRETDLEVALKRARWSELTLGDRVIRHGWAELTLLTAEDKEDVRVDTDGWHAVGAYEVGVLMVGEFVGERTGRSYPWARLKIRLARR